MTKAIQELQKKSSLSQKIRSYVALGSLARGEQTKKSDVDLVVRFSNPSGLFDFVGIKWIWKKLKRNVDLD